MRKYRDVLGVKQPTYLEKHLDLENNQLNYLGEWADTHEQAQEMHPQSGAGNFIGQAIPFIAAGVAGKGAEGTAAAARALDTEQIAADTAKEAADTAAYNKSALP
jgi:hypothetical protein